MLKRVVDICIYVTFAFVMIVCIYGKKNYHTDEISTYILSNNTFDSNIAVGPEDGKKYVDPEQIWLCRMTVSTDNRFNYKNVWEKQASDVHPPFYYVLVHTISSFFPEKFSKWFAGAVNIVFALLTLFFVRKIVMKLTSDPMTTFFVSVCICVSSGILSAVTFLRMYIMAMFFVSLVTFVFIQLVNKSSEKSGLLYRMCLYVVSVIGVLTHYYFLIYLFSICLVYGVYLLINKKWKDVALFLMTMVLSAVSAMLIFPSIITHSIGGGYRGSETIDSFLNNGIVLFAKKFQWSYDILDKQLFGGIWIVFLIVAIVCIVINIKKINIEWLLVIIPTVMYYVLISKMTPMVTDRYFHPIYPLLIMLCVSGLCILVRRWCKPRYAFVILGVVLTLTSLKEFKNNWYYLYRHSQNLINYAKAHSDLDCLYIYNQKFEINPSYLEVKEYNSVTFVPGNNYEIINNAECDIDNGLIVCAYNEFDEEMISDIVTSKWPLLNHCERIDSYSFSTTYYFSHID